MQCMFLFDKVGVLWVFVMLSNGDLDCSAGPNRGLKIEKRRIRALLQQSQFVVRFLQYIPGWLQSAHTKDVSQQHSMEPL